MSRAGLLERHEVVQEDDWFDVVIPEPTPEPAGTPVLNAIFAMRQALNSGIVPQVVVDIDDMPGIDELDDAAIRAFFDETD